MAASDEGHLLRAATNGVQASNDIGAALLSYASGGWRFRHVSYGSTQDQISALLTGECDWAVAKISDVLPYLTQEDAVRQSDETPVPTADEMPPLMTEVFEDEPSVPTEPEDEVDAETLLDADNKTDAHVDLGPSEHLRALGLFGTTRAPELPGLATLDELGYPTGWYGSTRAVVGPAGLDPQIVEYYAEAFRQVMSDPACIAAHREAGLSMFYLSPSELADRIDERERFNHSLLPRLFAA